MNSNTVFTDGLVEAKTTNNSNNSNNKDKQLINLVLFCESGYDEQITEISNRITLETILNGHNKEGSTCLMLCIIHDKFKTFQFILKTIRSAKISSARKNHFLNVRNIYGHSALHLSVICRNSYMLAELVEIGCDLLATDRELKNVYHHIAQYKLYGYVECIRRSMLRRFGDVESVKEMEIKIMSGRDCEGVTPLHTAIERSKDVRMLCELMEPLDMTDNRKRKCMLMLTQKCTSSALHLAVETGKVSLVEVVMYWLPDYARKEFINLENGCGNTAVHIGVAWDHIKCVELLLASGAGMMQRNAQNELASDYCQSDEMKELLFQTRR